MSDSDKSTIDLATRARWQRWEMESLEALQSRPRRRASDHDPLGKAELERQKKQVLANAREEGLTKGYQEGFADGKKAGYAEGLEAGKADGHAQGVQQGHAEGHAAGMSKGQAEGADLARDQAARLAELADTCAGSINDLEQEIGQKLIDLSIQIAEQVLRSHIKNHPNHIIDLVHEVMAARPDQNPMLHLRLNPSDMELVNSFLQHNPDKDRYRLIADEHISAGGCIVETAQGSIDATIETRWKRVVAALGHSESNGKG